MERHQRRRLEMAAAVLVFMLAVPTIASALPSLRTGTRDAGRETVEAGALGPSIEMNPTLARHRERKARLRTATRNVTIERTTYAPGPSSTGSGRADWYAVAACESGGNWAINTGNGYWGGLQFSPGTWYANGGGPFDGSGPFPYSAGQQIAVAERVLASQGPSAWPHCFRWA